MTPFVLWKFLPEKDIASHPASPRARIYLIPLRVSSSIVNATVGLPMDCMVELMKVNVIPFVAKELECVEEPGGWEFGLQGFQCPLL